MMLKTPPTHVIFDLDGTLLDTEPFYTVAAQAVVGRYGKVFDWTLKRRIIGGQASVGARVVIDALGLPLTPEEYLQERGVVMRELCKSTPEKPGARALVEALHARGVPLAIGTSSDHELCALKLGPHAFARCFHTIVCGSDPAVKHAKPAPDIFLVAAERLGATPSRCLVFEDTPMGVRAAVAAGMQVIAVPDPEMRSERYDGALAIIDSLEQVTLGALGL